MFVMRLDACRRAALILTLEKSSVRRTEFEEQGFVITGLGAMEIGDMSSDEAEAPGMDFLGIEDFSAILNAALTALREGGSWCDGMRVKKACRLSVYIDQLRKVCLSK